MIDSLRPEEKPTLFAQISELRRERGMRTNFYPKLVSRREISQAVSDFRMRCLDAAIENLEEVQKNTGRQ